MLLSTHYLYMEVEKLENAIYEIQLTVPKCRNPTARQCAWKLELSAGKISQNTKPEKFSPLNKLSPLQS